MTYIVVEGHDGCGKSTIVNKLNDKLSEKYDVVKTIHPGSTALGAHLRQLVKYTKTINENIVIDDLSRQTLYMVDTIAFIKTILEPSLKQNKIVLADRSSYISSVMYGLADGVKLKELDVLTDIIETPKADRVYVVTCSRETANIRSNRKDGDHYDSKSPDFFDKVISTYNNIKTLDIRILSIIQKLVNLNNIVHISSDNKSPDEILDFIINDLVVNKIIDI